MENLKKSIVGFSAIFILAITISSVAFAHGSNDRSSPDNLNMGGMGMMMEPSMMEDMGKMHSIMWNNDGISQEDFDWLRNKQEEHMGWSWLDKFENSDDFNEWKKPMTNSNQGMMRNPMMR